MVDGDREGNWPVWSAGLSGRRGGRVSVDAGRWIAEGWPLYRWGVMVSGA